MILEMVTLKTKIFLIFCLAILLTGCAQYGDGSASHDAGTEAVQDIDAIINTSTCESVDILSHKVFPPEGIIAPITNRTPESPKYETGEEIPVGRYAERFELNEVEYIESEWGYFDFAIEDNGNIIIDGAEFEDNKVVQALNELYSLEYVGISYLNEHLFCFGDDLLAIAKNPAIKVHSVYFRDSDYDESQLYYAYIFEPND